MARTQKDIANYFPHDANACSGDTLTVLQSRFGNDGYAFWFKLLERLTAAEGHCLDLSNPLKWQLFLAKMGVNELLGVEILNLLVEMHAIDGELWQSKLIWCQKLVDNLSDVYRNRRREIPQKPIMLCSNPLTTPGNTITTPDNPIPVHKVNKSKVKESKINNNIYGQFEEFWIAWPKKVSKADAFKAFCKLKPSDELFAVIMQAVESQKLSLQWRKDGGQYIPHAATWLNKARWEDEINGEVGAGLRPGDRRKQYTKPDG